MLKFLTRAVGGAASAEPMAAPVTGQKRKASQEAPVAEQPEEIIYEYDEIAVASPATRRSRSPLKEIKNSSKRVKKSSGKRMSTKSSAKKRAQAGQPPITNAFEVVQGDLPSAKRRRVLHCVLVQRHSSSTVATTQPVFSDHQRVHHSPPLSFVHDALSSSPSSTTSTKEAPAEGVRPRRSLQRRSYVTGPAFDESEDELNQPARSYGPKTKRRAKQRESDASDFEAGDDSASSVHDSDSKLSASDGEASLQSEDDFSELEAPNRKASSRNRSVGATKASRNTTSKNPPPPKTRMGKMQRRPKEYAKGLDASLPPLTDIDDIFDDIASKALDFGFDKVVKQLHNRPLRVVTMCSGTESPLLALQMIQSSVKAKVGHDIPIEHLFSAEIVPYKQAYIDRNFHPKLIFRDITEFLTAVNEERPMATTAFGGKEELPMNPDIVVAGTSCVDVSGLNNHKKTFSQQGESGDTWNAVLAYCRTARPSIVILENVLNAPWDAMLGDYESNGYEVAGVLVDTKDFYIPQTRQRGYMVCFDKEYMHRNGITGATKSWTQLMAKFKRLASSSATSFLLPNDQVEAKELQHVDDRKREVDWSKCKVTQSKYRLKERLGEARPLSNWNEDGSRHPPDNGSRAWYEEQVERVCDTIDIMYLRKAHPKNGQYDVRYKSRILDLSQNCYRQTDHAPFGIASCITPTAMYFLSDAGRVMLAQESLMLQGLPLDKISFTTETASELQSLAGNAMTTTVVGSAIVAALIASYGILDDEDSPMTDSDAASPTRTKLTVGPTMPAMTTATLSCLDVASLREKVNMALRRCHCEGRYGIATAPIQRCQDCSHITCTTCGGNPRHSYQLDPELSKEGRMQPHLFEEWLRSQVPLRIKLDSLDDNTLALLHAQAQDKVARNYLDLVRSITNETFLISTFRRTQCLMLNYVSSSGRLELVMTETDLRWRLFIQPPKELARNNRLREELKKPVAVSIVTTNLFESPWAWRIPSKTQNSLSIRGHGDRQPAWLARLQLPDYKDKRQWQYLTISVSDAVNSRVKKSIEGTYTYRPDCGTANDSLYVKSGVKGQERMYLFFDPDRLGEPEDDRFVFTADICPLEYDAARPTVASVLNWRAWTQDKEAATAILETTDVWIQGVDQKLRSLPTNLNARVPKVMELSRTIGGCDEAAMVFSFDVPMDSNDFNGPIDNEDREFSSKFFWAFEMLRRHALFDEWHEFNHNDAHLRCQVCAPHKPQVKWKLDGKDVMSYPDPVEATRYERALKQRSEPVVIAAERGSSTTRISLGINLLSLAHRAFSRLPEHTHDVRFEWKICSSAKLESSVDRFHVSNTEKFDPYQRDLQCSFGLFPVQKTSLTWMRRQEAASGQPCTVEESEETTVASLGLRIEMKATGVVYARGGIAADHPGFGKTVTTLALVQSRFLDSSTEDIHEELQGRQNTNSLSKGLLTTSATLIVQPTSLMGQWLDEIDDKLGYTEGVYSIKTSADLAKLTIDKIRRAKIICLSPSVLTSEIYNDRLAAFAGLPSSSALKGRAFAHWLSAAVKAIAEHLEIQQNKGNTVLREHATAKYKAFLNNDALIASVPSQRLRGRNYVAASKRKSNGKEDISAKTSATHPQVKTIGTPLLHMFYWDRVVVDEFHQYEPCQLEALRFIQADKRWGLSGTPAMDDAYDVASTASLLGLTLRIGSDARGAMKAANIRALRKDMTPAELFYAMRQKHSPSVESQIRRTGQRFLDSFVRRNVEKFEQIGCDEHLVPVQLNLGHRAIYQELLQDSISKGMRIQKSSLSKSSDRDQRISTILSQCKTTEEAFSMLAACQQTSLKELLRIRKFEFEHGLYELETQIKHALASERHTFEEWKQSKLILNGLGDADTVSAIRQLCADHTTGKSKPDKDETRDITSKVNTLAMRLVVAKRSLRFLDNSIALHEGNEVKPAAACNCCEVSVDERSPLTVSANCGHIVCATCYDEATSSGGSSCPVEDCSALIRDYNLLWSKTLEHCRISETAHGAKMKAIADILAGIKAKDEQAILFVQYNSQLFEAQEALKHYGISAIVVTDLSQAGQRIKEFRDNANNAQKKRTVLVLNQSDETAAGFNIQNANHVIFLGPILSPSLYDYEARMAQAVGRVRRHGQKRKLHIYRVVALDTIDVDILEHRETRRTAIAEIGASEITPPPALAKLKRNNREPEATQLVCENGHISLRPKSWLVKCGADEDAEQVFKGLRDKGRVLGWEGFTSNIKFSKEYTDNDR